MGGRGDPGWRWLGSALGTTRRKGRDTGAAIDTKAGWVTQFRGGLMTRFQTFAERARAVEAVGLRE
jgi:ketosteroid isomerase-like protein